MHRWKPQPPAAQALSSRLPFPPGTPRGAAASSEPALSCVQPDDLVGAGGHSGHQSCCGARVLFYFGTPLPAFFKHCLLFRFPASPWTTQGRRVSSAGWGDLASQAQRLRGVQRLGAVLSGCTRLRPKGAPLPKVGCRRIVVQQRKTSGYSGQKEGAPTFPGFAGPVLPSD